MTPEEKDTLQPTQTKSEPEDNHDSVSTFLYFFGALIIIVMSIVGYYMLTVCGDYSYRTLNPLFFVPPAECFVSGIFYGLVLIGIGRIIKVIPKKKK